MKRIKTNSLGARVLSGFLSFLMVVSACPITAFAEDDYDATPAVVSDESETETSDAEYTITVDENGDVNLQSIPEDENAEDQTDIDVETPPNIEDSSDEDRTSETTIVEDTSDTTTEDTDKKEETSEETSEEAKPVYEYVVSLSDDATVSEGDTLNVVADATATVTEDGETKDVEFEFNFSVDGEDAVIETSDASKATIIFNKAGEYTVTGTMVVNGEEVASDSMVVTVEKSLPVVEFDHYFTDIDESLVETSDLFVKTNDSSVFTKNTNVVSNYDNVYIISFASVEEARFAYSYYVDKVDSISDLSKVISTATEENDADVADMENLNEGDDAIAQLNEIVEDTETTDYSDYIALIDTGADADANFSVVGDDTSDATGHGTRMLELIKGENPDAKVMSIRVFNGNSTDAASVYAGIKLAIENDVKIINLSLVGSDVTKNAIVKDVIKEAIDKGIVVIGAAGNYNLSATKFIPGCIDEVIVIGAAKNDGTKVANSNYDVDYYVIANSTSEATAIFTGMYSTENFEDDRLFDGDFNPTKITELPNDYSWLEGIDIEYRINEDGSVTFFLKNPWEEDDFVPAEGHSEAHTKGTYVQSNALAGATAGTHTSSGTCWYVSGSAGNGRASAFSGNDIFEKVWAAAGSPSIYCSCERYWNGVTDQSAGADWIHSGDEGKQIYYTASSNVSFSADGSEAYLKVDLRFSEDGNYTVNWLPGRDDSTYHSTLAAGTEGHMTGDDWEGVVRTTVTVSKNGHAWKSYTVDTDEIRCPASSISSEVTSAAQNQMRNAITYFNNVIKPDIISSEFSGKRNPSITVDWQGTGGTRSTAIVVNYEYADHNQIYHGIFDAWCYRYLYLDISKSVTNTELITDAYNISGTHIIAYLNGSPVKDINGNTVEFSPSSTGTSSEFTLAYDTYANKTITWVEDKVGYGYNYQNGQSGTLDLGGGGSHNHISVTNKPMYDPPAFKIQKVSDNTGSNDFDGDARANGAYFEVKYFTDAARHNNTRTWVMHTDSDGLVRFGSTSYYVANSGNPFYEPGSTSILVWPVGYYEIRETKAPSNGNQPTGLYVNNKVFTAEVLPDGEGADTTGDYHQANYVNFWIKDGNTTIIKRVDRVKSSDTGYYIDYNIKGTIDNDTAAEIDRQDWRPFGVIKADYDLVDLDKADGSLIIPEGNGKYNGAQYQVFSTSTKTSEDYFKITYNNPNGSAKLTFGNAVTSIPYEDGVGHTGTYNVPSMRPILKDGKPIIITLNENGYGQTDVKFPYGENYKLVEIKAPEGFKINTKVWSFAITDWEKLENNDVVHVTLSDYLGTVHDVVKITEDSNRDGAATDTIARYGFSMYKKDKTSENDNLNNQQGSGSLNGIRFAVINMSDNRVVLRNQYNNQCDPAYCTISDGTEIGKGKIVAILTTHTVAGKQGCIRMFGLPYGTYRVVELRRNNSITDASLINKTYTDSIMGNSKFANDSYLFDTNVFDFDYTEVDNKEYDGIGNMSHFSKLYDATKPNETAQNKVFIDGFQGYKLDNEYIQITEGDSSANEIRFAVVNRSTRSVEILESDLALIGTHAEYVDYKPHTQIGNGQVVAILTTHDNNATRSDGKSVIDGYFAIYGLPYGKYDVYELRRDATIEVGNNFTETTWSTGGGVYGTSIYSNDSFYWKNLKVPYDLTDTYSDNGTDTHPTTVDASLARHNYAYATDSNPYKDNVFRDGFSFWKRDLTKNKLSDTPQGDATFNDIRYAVINVSEDPIKLFDKYINMLPANEKAAIQQVNGKAIEPGQVAAIITTHQKTGTSELTNGNMQGYAALFGLPYGKYEIYELRRDATITIGDNWSNDAQTAGGGKYGTSIYANYRTLSQVPNTNQYPSMLWNNDIHFVYTLEDTEDGAHEEFYEVGNLHETDDNERGIREDETVYGSIWIHKYDRETATQTNQGTNSLAGIQFAVVNRSQWSVTYPYESTDPKDVYEPGEVIAVVETDEAGNTHLEHMCYGSYDVYELRISNDKCDNNDTYGHTVKPHDVFDVDAYKNSGKAGASQAAIEKYGNDDRANEWYCWNESVDNVRVINTDTRTIAVDYTVTPQEGRTIRTQDQENHYDYYDMPIRSDLKFIKVNMDGKRMPYVPFLLSLVETDAEGKPIQNADGTYKVIEEHVVVTDVNGEFDSRDWVNRPKTAATVNQLDGKVDGMDFTGKKADLIAAAGQNVWFGDIERYQTADQYFVDKRGSLLAGCYVLQELRRSEKYGFDKDDAETLFLEESGQYRKVTWNTEDFDMIASKVYIVHDNRVYEGEDWDIGVDIPLYIKSEALDTKSLTDAIVPEEHSALRDTVEFGNLNSTQRWGYTTEIYRIDTDGNKHLMKETEMCVLDFTGPKYVDPADGKEYAQLKNADGTYTVVKDGYQIALTADGTFVAEYEPAQNPTNYEYNVIHDFKVAQDFELDTTECQEGEKIAFAVRLYKSIGASGWQEIKSHNLDLTETTQEVGIIGFQTQATNKTTGNRIASLGGYAYGEDGMPLTYNGTAVYNENGEIVGYTLVDDKIMYKNLANNHNYRFAAKLVDDNGVTVKDIYGNECSTPLLAIYIDEGLTKVMNGTDIVFNGVLLQKSLEGPRDGEITFSDFGFTDWIIPNDPNGSHSVHMVVDLYDARGPLLKSHNINLDEENENIRFMQMTTTAMSADGVEGVIPNGRSWDLDGKLQKSDVKLIDKIHYSNLAEPTTIRVEGYVYLLKFDKDGKASIDTDNNLDTPYVAYTTKNFDISNPEDTLEMEYTVKDPGQYANRKLVVCERVYMDVVGYCTQEDFETDGRTIDAFGHYVYGTATNKKYIMNDTPTEVLIALHEDLDDEKQQVSIPEIETHLVNKHEGTGYKVVSRTYADVTLTDTVTYRNLPLDKPWTVTAALMNQKTKEAVIDEATGKPVTGSVTFTPTAENSTVINGRAYGTIDVPITFKQLLTNLEWEDDPSYVCFENVKAGDKGPDSLEYAVHNNIFDERQTVHVPVFRTTAKADFDGSDKQFKAAPNQKVVDYVEIKNIGLDTVIKGTLEERDLTITDIVPATFTLKIEAYDAKTGETILDKDGKPYTATKEVNFDVARENGAVKWVDGKPVLTVNGEEQPTVCDYNVYPDGAGTDFTTMLFGTSENPIIVDIPLVIDATELKGKVIAFHETLYFGTTTNEGSEVIVEDSNEHVEQMVTVPDIHTTAINPETNDHYITISGNGIDDEDWYLKAGDLSKYDWKLTDTIELINLKPDTDYTVVTALMNKDTKEFVKNADGTLFIAKENYHSPKNVADGAESEITCDCGKEGCCGTIAVNSKTQVELNLNNTDARNGGTFVVYEYLLLGSDKDYTPNKDEKTPTDVYAYHNDIDDEGQTIIVPEIHTEFLDIKTETHVVPLDEDATVVDTVSYKGLKGGDKYTMECVLMDRDTNAPFVDEDGNLFKNIVEFTADESGEGTVEVEFTISKDILHNFDIDEEGNGNSIVAFELCRDENGRAFAIHADIKDKDQTITVPRVHTTLTDCKIGDHVSKYGPTETIVDTVAYYNLQPGEKYTMTGKLVNKDTGEDILDAEGNVITTTKEFTVPADSDGSGIVEIEFVVDTMRLKGTHVVAFEDCYYKEIRVATHADIEDKDQWTFIPTIGTTLIDRTTDDKVTTYGSGNTVPLVDTVSYDKLLPNRWYVMTGILMDKTTNKPLVDKDGNTFTGKTYFKPTGISGTVDVDYNIDTELLEGVTIVAFEECYYIGLDKDAEPISSNPGHNLVIDEKFNTGDRFTEETAKQYELDKDDIVAEHKDIKDVDQTVYVPKVRTTVKDKVDGDKQIDGTKITQTVIDTVSYTNLFVGKEYTVKGKLRIKGTDDYVRNDKGEILIVEKTFTAEAPANDPDAKTVSGTIDLEFTFDASKYAGQKVVVFEDLYYKGIRVATHSDINDEGQTFEISMLLHVKLVKSDFDHHEYVLKNAEITIYTDKECKNVAKDVNGKDCIGSTNADGIVEFTVCTYNKDQVFYAKETKAPFGYKICNDVVEIKGTPYYGATDSKTENIEASAYKEAAGICAINLKMFDKIIIIPPKTGDNLPILPIVLCLLFGAICVAAFFVTKPKKVPVKTEESDEAEEVAEEVEDSMIALMNEDIDGTSGPTDF